jgi:dihydrodipicolinate synthase/N-acetylneuraminate lyase
MVLPPYVYKGDWREMKTHMAAVFRATSLPCMLYNNPIAYKVDVTPEVLRELYQDAIDGWWDEDAYQAALEREAAERDELA